MSNIDDIKNWRSEGLPMICLWNTGGHKFNYHIQQVRDGHRFLPTVRLPAFSSDNSSNANNHKTTDGILDDASDEDYDFFNENNLPICIRTNNINNAFAALVYRLPMLESNIPLSPLVWRYENNVLNDSPIADMFGPTSIWASEGEGWATSYFMTQLQSKIPNPDYVIFRENNEGSDDNPKRYYSTVGFDGQDEYGDLPLVWKTLSQLRGLSLRVRDYHEDNPDNDVIDFLYDRWNLTKDQYLALYNAFNDNLTDDWKDKITTVAYGVTPRQARPPRWFSEFGYFPELSFRDTGSPARYSFGASLVDFTRIQIADVLNWIPVWQEHRNRNEKFYIDISLNISDGATLKGARLGKHDVITPDRYRAYIEWMLWSIRITGVPIILTYWIGNASNPTDLMFELSNHADLDAFGYPELKTATVHDYNLALMDAADNICDDENLRDFWQNGITVVVPEVTHPMSLFPVPKDNYLPYPVEGQSDDRWRVLKCNQNTSVTDWKTGNTNDWPDVVNKVWAVATTLGRQCLIYAWTPCNLTGTILVNIPFFGNVEIDAPSPSSYTIIDLDSNQPVAETHQSRTVVTWTPSTSESVVKQIITLINLDTEESSQEEVDPDVYFRVYYLPLATNYRFEITIHSSDSDPIPPESIQVQSQIV